MFANMLKEERLQKILSLLEKDKRVLLSELSRELYVSEDTVRRDIRELSLKGLLHMVRGGAVPHAPGPKPFHDRIHFASSDKQVMATKALSLLKDGQVVIFDGGTSTLAVASILPPELKITVVTNSFPIANLLATHPCVQVLFAGGRLYKESIVTVGLESTRFFGQIRADLCFMGVCSIHLELGLTNDSYEESEVKMAMIAHSRKVVALTTPEKIDTAESYYICPAAAVNTIITPGTCEHMLEPFRSAGITIL
ncbi:MAG: DeoR/GlpR family DNA-binding transcription regulator [Chitinophagaceae bacterium]